MTNNIPELIYENCPSCHPLDYVKTKSKFTGEVEDCGSHIEYLYKCCGCGSLVWIEETNAKGSAVQKGKVD